MNIIKRLRIVLKLDIHKKFYFRSKSVFKKLERKSDFQTNCDSIGKETMIKKISTFYISSRFQEREHKHGQLSKVND